jgi:release factor glutamine methyltransferase
MKSFALSIERLSAKELLREGVLALQAAHVESASLDARLLLEHALGLSREQLLFRLDDMLEQRHIDYFRELVACRTRRQPIAQIIGRREFFGLTFKVTSAVLDPRPDSETLIEAVIKRTRDKQAPLTILDLGTGSGCLLLTLLYEFPNAKGVGVDTSRDAINVAKDNAVNLGLQSRAAFIQSHWCMAVEGTYDIIISNPPYIPAADISTLAPEVSQYEPKQALDGGADGLACYRVIVAALPKHLKKGGLAAIELGLGQAQAVERLAIDNGLKPLGIAHDIQGIARCIILTH